MRYMLLLLLFLFSSTAYGQQDSFVADFFEQIKGLKTADAKEEALKDALKVEENQKYLLDLVGIVANTDKPKVKLEDLISVFKVYVPETKTDQIYAISGILAVAYLPKNVSEKKMLAAVEDIKNAILNAYPKLDEKKLLEAMMTAIAEGGQAITTGTDRTIDTGINIGDNISPDNT